MNKKIKLLLFFLLLLFSYADAQYKIRMQGTAAIPTGYAEDAVSAGFGGSINLSRNIFLQNLELSLTTGFLHFGMKENLPGYDFSFNSIPLLLGIRFNFTDYDFIPYAGIELGRYFMKYFLEIDYGYFGKTSVVTNDSHWGFSPELGFRLNITPAADVDVNVKYNNIYTKYIARAFLLIQTGFAYRF